MRRRRSRGTGSLDAELGEEVRQAARKAGTAGSAWLADAAVAKLRSEALTEFLDSWEGEHGPLSVEELRRADADLGLGNARD